MKQQSQKKIDNYNNVVKLLNKNIKLEVALKKVGISRTAYYNIKRLVEAGLLPPGEKNNKLYQTEKAYKVVKEYIKKNPKSSAREACIATKTPPATFYNARRIIEGKNKSVEEMIGKTVKKEIEIIEEKEISKKMVVIVCEASELKKVMSNIFNTKTIRGK